MSLPVVTGRGYLISDGVQVQFSQGGTAWARLPLSFKNRHRDADGNWTHDKEILLEGVVFGPLAEFLADNVTGRTDMNVTGELYSEEYEGKARTKLMVTSVGLVANAKRQPVAAGKAPAAGAKPGWGEADDVPF